METFEPTGSEDVIAEEDVAPEVIAAGAAFYRWGLSVSAPYDILASVL